MLPALQELRIQLSGIARLPAAWAGGFRRLELIVLSSFTDGILWQASSVPASEICHKREATTAGDAAAAAAAAEGAAPGQGLSSLPPEWAGPGSFPSLSSLELNCLPLWGPLPRSWQDGGFPQITQL